MAIIKRFWNFLVAWGEAVAEHRKNSKTYGMY